jgi:pimeloyl-ACP methyl ester carboxylesterase
MAIKRSSVSTRFGEFSYREAGDGPSALFIHGVMVSSLLWENAIAELSDERRCIAVDLPGHGRTRVDNDDLSFRAYAEMLEDFCDTLGLGRIDLVGNDSGGAIAQFIAARGPERLRTLTLTNCDVYDNVPPEAFKPVVDMAADGGLAPLMKEVSQNADAARQNFAVGYEHPENLPDEKVLEFLEPFASEEGARDIEARIVAPKAEELMAIDPALQKLDVPTLLVWGTGDIYFDISWAHRLRDTIPGVTDLVEIEGAKLFFVDERADELVPLIRKHWAAHPESSRRPCRSPRHGTGMEHRRTSSVLAGRRRSPPPVRGPRVPNGPPRAWPHPRRPPRGLAVSQTNSGSTD